MSGFETIAALVGAGTTAAGTVAAGAAEKRNQEFIARQEEQKADEELAASQREAMQSKREARLAASRQQALAASSGGGAASDAPTIVRLMSDVAGQGQFNAASNLYGGQQRAAGLRDSAKGRRASGRASFLGSVLGGFGQAASGAYKAWG